MHRGLTPKRFSSQLTASVRDNFVHVHVELSAAPSHPHVQGKLVLILPIQNLLTNLDYEVTLFPFEVSHREIDVSRCFLQYSIGLNHLAWNQILTDAEVLE